MNPVKALYDLTNELCESLKDVPQDQRDAAISRLTELLNRRDDAISDLKGPYQPEEMEMGKEIIEKNFLIDQRLKAIMSDIVNDRKAVSIKKRTSNKYRNPYQDMPRDGMFLDKKE